MNQTTKRRFEQIRQRWWVVVALTVLGVLIAGVMSLTTPTSYVGKSTLLLSGRTPDQDAVMALGYLAIFNDPVTTTQLRTKAGLPESVTFEARTAAASPILTIEATADSPTAAQDAAQRVSQAFSDGINSAQQAGRDQHLADLQRQIDELNPLEPDGATNPLYADLRMRIDDAQSNSTNELLALQPRAGVSEIAPSTVYNLMLGALGGVVLGVLAALGLAALSTRLTNAADMKEKTGVKLLADIPAGGSAARARARDNRVSTLANIVSFENLPKPSVVTLTDSGESARARDVAEALAKLSARQGARTVLVYADNEASSASNGAGFNEAVSNGASVTTSLVDGGIAGLKILRAGATVTDRYSVVTRERLDKVLEKLRADADIVVVAAPSIASAPESQLLCAAADITILTVAKGAKAAEVESAVKALASSHAVLLGAVLVDESGDKVREEAVPAAFPPAGAPTETRNGVGPVEKGQEPRTEAVAYSNGAYASWPTSTHDHN